MLEPLGVRNFRLLWLGESVSLLGDQFFFVALSWLTLELTGSGLALGTVLMAGAIPRAIFMLLGGALSDRISPRTLMLASNAFRAILTALLTLLVLLRATQLWQLYLLSVAFGLVDAFFYPSFQAITPRLVEAGKLEGSNALLQATAQLTGLVGPAPAGLAISALGLPVAFGFDAFTFVFAAAMLGLMRGVPSPSLVLGGAAPGSRAGGRRKPASLFADIGQGMRFALGHPMIRALLVIVATVDFSFVGPFNVGAAWLADHRFAGGATALGIMLSAWGGGALAGALVAGSIGHLRRRGWLAIGVTSLMGVMLALVGVVPNVLFASLVVAWMGLGSGFINVIIVSWLQRSVETGLLGRLMSLVMFASQGLAPVSYVIAGFLVDAHATVMFLAAGCLVLLGSGYAAANRAVREFD
ncbi:MAG: MFS transporter [Anaerolineales bacterium]